ncbi:Oxidoreductase [Melia azedarach]|uniref:Oxidoreductase n=1 Tax=Melia azedarach TaxID=155640 RepID=A0ACC1Y0K2_MELAZ|nr:Oxidoreductase [Melia azedarach]
MNAATFNSISFTLGYLWKDEGKISRGMKRNEKVKFHIRGSATLPTESLQIEDGKAPKSQKQVRIGLLGAAGYMGA